MSVILSNMYLRRIDIDMHTIRVILISTDDVSNILMYVIEAEIQSCYSLISM